MKFMKGSFQFTDRILPCGCFADALFPENLRTITKELYNESKMEIL